MRPVHRDAALAKRLLLPEVRQRQRLAPEVSGLALAMPGSGLRSADLDPGRNRHAQEQAAADCLVLVRLSHGVGVKRDLGAAAEEAAQPGELPDGLAPLRKAPSKSMRPRSRSGLRTNRWTADRAAARLGK